MGLSCVGSPAVGLSVEVWPARHKSALCVCLEDQQLGPRCITEKKDHISCSSLTLYVQTGKGGKNIRREVSDGT